MNELSSSVRLRIPERLILTLLLLAFVGALDARALIYKTLDGQSGLVQNTVNSLAQDPQNFLWIGTQGGLHRYDGFALRFFQHDPGQPNSLPDSLVSVLHMGANGRLWIGTESAGVASILVDSGSIHRYAQSARDKADRFKRIIALLDVPGLGLWVADSRSLSFWPNYQPNSAETLFHFEAGSNDVVTALASDDEGGIYIATERSGLYHHKSGKLRGIDFAPSANGSIEIPAIRHIAVDKSGRVFASSTRGLHVLAPGRKSLTEIEAIRLPTSQLAIGQDGAIWMNTEAIGLTRLDPGLTQRESFTFGYGIDAGNPDRGFTSLLIDRAGLLWAGTKTQGVMISNTQKNAFKHALNPAEAATPAAPLQNNIRALAASESGFYSGGESGIVRLHRSDGVVTQAVTLYEPTDSPEKTSMRALRIHALAKRGQTLFAGTSAGLFAANLLENERIGSFSQIAPEHAKTVRALRISADESLLVGTDNGLLLFNENGVLISHTKASPQALPDEMVLALFEDLDGRLYVGTRNGLAIKSNGAWQSYQSEEGNPRAIPGNLIRSFTQSQDRKIWIATHSGLARIDRFESRGANASEATQARAVFSRFSARDGLPNSTVYSVSEDELGRVWLSGNRGIVLFSPNTSRWRSFGTEDGLQSLEFNGNAITTLATGELVFGGINGINIVQPRELALSEEQAPVRLLGVQRGRNRGFSLQNLGPTRPFVAPFTDRVFSFQFAALDFIAPNSTQFAYKLEGFDEGWVFGQGLGVATYTNLEPGNYQLLVRGSNRDRVWGPQELRIPVRILPPWWRHPAAQLGYGLLSLTAISCFLFYRRKRQRSESAMLNALKERELRLRLSLSGSRDLYWDYDVKTQMLLRDACEPVLGEGSNGVFPIASYLKSEVHPEDQAVVVASFQKTISEGADECYFEHRLRDKSGKWVWVSARGHVVSRGDDGKSLRLAGTSRNIEEARTNARDLAIADRVVDRISDGVAVTNEIGTIVKVNPAFEQMLGLNELEVINLQIGYLRSPRHDELQFQSIVDVVKRDGRWRGELWLARKNGSDVLVSMEINRLEGQDLDETLRVWVFSDITDRKRAEEELRFRANFDSLTGLPNRSMLLQQLTRAIARCKRHNYPIAVVFLDLDRFKQINDSLGHAAGDELLRAVADRLRKTVREIDTAARMSGDEFVLLLEELASPEDAELAAKRVLEQFVEPFNLLGTDVVVSPSIGVAVFPRDAILPEDLLKCADLAMYSAKAAGRNTVRVYSAEQSKTALERAALERQLRVALERDQFDVYFQPCYSLLSGKIVGVEALLRWRDPIRGLVTPDVFIPILEDSGLIVAVGEWVLHESLSQLKAWERVGLKDLFISVNLSLIQLARGQLAQKLPELLKNYALPGHRLTLELTESLVMANPDESIAILNEISNLGVQIAVDDFGTGYSSLAYLKRLPLDKLKIDKAFVSDIVIDADDQAIVRSIIALAKALDLEVVAEGVENAAQRDLLIELGCHQAQGFLFSAALPAIETTQLLRAEQNSILG